MRCPECGSSAVKKSQAVHEQGTRESTYDGRSASISTRGTISLGRHRGQSSGQSLAAQKNAPPIDSGLVMTAAGTAILTAFFFVLGIINLSFSFILLGVIAFIAGIGWSVAQVIRPSEASRELSESYSRQWYCTRCGNLFFKDEGTLAGPEASVQSRNLASTPFSYSGASPPIRHGSYVDRTIYVERVLRPRQRASSATARDLSGLRHLIAISPDRCVFDPVAACLDVGVASRLSSLSYIGYEAASDTFFVTAAGKSISNY